MSEDISNEGVQSGWQTVVSTANGKSQFNGDISTLFKVPELRPLTDFPFLLRPVTEHLSSIGHGWYLLAGVRSIVKDDLPRETIRACMILWGENDFAAIRASLCDDALPQGGAAQNANELPPVELFMPSANSWKYGEILRAGRGRIMESAVYGPNGEFRYKEVNLSTSHVNYSSRTRKTSELPFALSLIKTSK